MGFVDGVRYSCGKCGCNEEEKYDEDGPEAAAAKVVALVSDAFFGWWVLAVRVAGRVVEGRFWRWVVWSGGVGGGGGGLGG